MMAMFFNIQGFGYTMELYSTSEEAMKTIGMQPNNGKNHFLGWGIEGRDQQ
jgi:hypothetical protein